MDSKIRRGFIRLPNPVAPPSATGAVYRRDRGPKAQQCFRESRI